MKPSSIEIPIYFRFILAILLAGTEMLCAEPAEAPESSAQTLTIQRAIQIALEKNPELGPASAEIDAAIGRQWQLDAWPNPELEFMAEEVPVNGWFSRSRNLVGIAQTVPFPGKKGWDRKIGRTEVRLREAELELRRIELIRDVTIAFHRALASERQLHIAEELFHLSDSLGRTARKRVDAGAAPFQEQLRAEIEAERARAGLASYSADLTAHRAELAALLGQPETAEWHLEGDLSNAASLVQESGVALWNAQHPALRSISLEREQAEAELGRARLEPYPDVRVAIAGGRNEALREEIFEFRISVPLPIFDRGRGKLREARARAQIADAELAGAEQRLIRDWTIARARQRAASEQVAAYQERILPRAADAHRLVQGGFEQGKFDFIDLLDMQRTAAEARLTFEEKLLDLQIAQAELDALTSYSQVKNPK